MRATFLAGGPRDRAAASRAACAASTSRRRPRSCSTSRCRSTARASCGATCSGAAAATRRCRSSGSTTSTASSSRRRPRSTGSTSTVGGAAQLATLFDEEAAALPGPDAAARGRRQRRRLAAELGAARRPAGDRRGERLGARRHELRQPRVRLRRGADPARTQARADFPFLSANIVEEATGDCAGLAASRSAVFRVNGVRVGVIGATVRTTPELVRAGRHRRPRVPRRGGAHPRASRERLRAPRRAGADRRHPRGRGRSAPTRSTASRRSRGRGRSSASSRRCRTRRSTSSSPATRTASPTRSSAASRSSRASTPAAATPSPSCMVRGGDVAWAGTATRVAKNLGVAARADVQGDRRRRQRRDGGAAQRGHRDAGGRHPARPDPPERVGDGQPGRRRDARQVPGRRRGADQLGRPARRPARRRRRRRASSPARSRGARCSPCCPFGNRTVIETLTGEQLTAGAAQRRSARPATRRSPRAASRRSPGCKIAFHCDGTTPVVDSIAPRAAGPGGPADADRAGGHGPHRHQRLHVHAAATATRRWPGGTDVLQPGDALLDVAIEYIGANSPVARRSRAAMTAGP